MPIDNRSAKAEVDAYEWQLIWALIAGWCMVATRIAALVYLLVDGHRDVGTLLAESVACAALMTRFQQRQLFAPLVLLGIWAVGFFNMWQGEDAPAFVLSVASLSVGAGLCLGIFALTRLRAMGRVTIEPPAA